MSGVDPAFAKTHIQEALSNLPADDFIWQNPIKNPMTPGRDNGAGIYVRALYEQAPATLAPNIILHRMMKSGDLDYIEGEDDPRLPVIFTPTRYTKTNWQFNGVSGNWDTQYLYWPTQTPPDGVPYIDNGPGITVRTFVNQPTDADEMLRRWLRSGYSLYNIGTFTYGEIPVYMNSRAENDLFLAEVEMKGLAATGKTAAEHIRASVVNSTDYWYRVNSFSLFWKDQLKSVDSLQRVFAPVKPSDAIINQFANKVVAEFEAATGEDAKMEIIMQQKYIHHNIINIYELFAELRRTRHPKLEKLKVDGVEQGPMVERVRYPASEQRNNAENFDKVTGEHNFTSHIFWVPENKRNESYYMDGYLPLRGFLPLPVPNPNRP